jgi:surface carbohydrate biosynthesis protein
MSLKQTETKKATLLIPVELQVRELDSKLLLACVAARRGFPSIIGPRREMHFHIPSFPRSIYLSKSTTSGSKTVFRILRQLGHDVVAWDEEALVHLPPETYYKRRLSPQALKHVSCLFAWGEDNAELWRQYPHMPSGLPIHITGHPRGDLMRREMRSLYEEDVRRIQSIYGNFILINTNFNQVNAYYPDMNLLKPPANPGQKPELGRRAIGTGMSREYAEGFTRHKKAIFKDFQQLIPALNRAFPDFTIVVRPHPVENQEVYQSIADKCQQVHVINEGNVVPWLIAAKALVHNGCTTGVEAYMLGVPTVAYRKTIDEGYDHDYHRLPNLVSIECFTLDQLQATLAKIISGATADDDSDKRKAIMDHHLAALNGPLACERMVDVFEMINNGHSQQPEVAIQQRLRAWFWAHKRRFKKRFRGYFPDMSHNRAKFLRHRYPGISMEELQARVSRLQEVIGDTEPLRIEPVYRQFYRISR